MYKAPKSAVDNAGRTRFVQVGITGIVILIIAVWFIQTSDFFKAVQKGFSEIQSSGPETSRSKFYFDEGLEHLEKSEWEEAEKSFSESIKLDDTNAEAYHQRGRARGQLLKIMEAKLDQNRALRRDKNHVGAYRERGWINYLQSNYDEAIKDLLKSISLTENFEAYRMLGLVYTDQRQWNDAIEALSKAIKLMPHTQTTFEASMVYEMRGFCYLGAGKVDLAIEDLNAGIDIEPFSRTQLRHQVEGLREQLSKLSPDSQTYHNLEQLIDRILN